MRQPELPLGPSDLTHRHAAGTALLRDAQRLVAYGYSARAALDMAAEEARALAHRILTACLAREEVDALDRAVQYANTPF